METKRTRPIIRKKKRMRTKISRSAGGWNREARECGQEGAGGW